MMALLCTIRKPTLSTSSTLQHIVIPSDRRSGQDRRRGGFPAFWHSLWRRRRRARRRPEDRAGAGYYLDVLSPTVLFAAIAVVLCSCADILFTLRLLERGAVEVNPLMKLLIERDTALFVQIKIAATLSGVLVIAAHAHFRLLRIMRGCHTLYGLAAMYLILNAYQIGLLTISNVG